MSPFINLNFLLKNLSLVRLPLELLSNIFNLEKESVLSSDFQIAVSKQLVNYWKQEFNYEKINNASRSINKYSILF